jgi:hypothetical protein|tara:strand:- start:1777 stop:1917 length:141 start_codon:yes stop_codon:yes gene_type:complete
MQYQIDYNYIKNKEADWSIVKSKIFYELGKTIDLSDYIVFNKKDIK